jgi:RNA polymerase sigma factor (sigma-70 family)
MYTRWINTRPRLRLVPQTQASWAAAGDNELIARMQTGNPAPFDELYGRYQDRAHRVALGVLGRTAYAEEAVQEAFASIWNSRATYRPDRPTAASWVLTVVHHRAIDIARRNSAYEAARVSDVALDQFPSCEDIASDVFDRMEVRDLKAVMARLPDVQREVIVLAFYGGLSQTEIAARLSLPLGTVKARIRRGLAKLRAQIESEAA